MGIAQAVISIIADDDDKLRYVALHKGMIMAYRSEVSFEGDIRYLSSSRVPCTSFASAIGASQSML